MFLTNRPEGIRWVAPVAAAMCAASFIACGVTFDGPSSTDSEADGALEEPIERSETLTTELERLREENAQIESRVASQEALIRQREEQRKRQMELLERELHLAQQKAELDERQRQARAEQERLARARSELDSERDQLEEQKGELDSRENRIADEQRGLDEEQEREQVEPPRDSDRASFGDEEWRNRRRLDDRDSNAAERLRAGMTFEVELQEQLASDTNQAGDTFRTLVIDDIYDEQGVTVVPAGSELFGVVVEARPLRRVGGQASLALELNRLVLAGGETIELRASFVELGQNQKRDKKKIAGAAIAGAVLGRILGDGEAALVGAAVGAAAGTAAVMRSKGQEVEIPAGTTLELRLEEVVTVSTEYRGLARDG